MAVFKTFAKSLFQLLQHIGKTVADNVIKLFNIILLTVVYFLGIGITAITAKITKKHFLNLTFDKNATTYWIEKKNKTMKTSDYQRQF